MKLDKKKLLYLILITLVCIVVYKLIVPPKYISMPIGYVLEKYRYNDLKKSHHYWYLSENQTSILAVYEPKAFLSREQKMRKVGYDISTNEGSRWEYSYSNFRNYDALISKIIIGPDDHWYKSITIYTDNSIYGFILNSSNKDNVQTAFNNIHYGMELSD